ncbi:hypothetical protein PMIN07_000085 [Paraphaeosphaeria minitans]
MKWPRGQDSFVNQANTDFERHFSLLATKDADLKLQLPQQKSPAVEHLDKAACSRRETPRPGSSQPRLDVQLCCGGGDEFFALVPASSSAEDTMVPIDVSLTPSVSTGDMIRISSSVLE